MIYAKRFHHILERKDASSLITLTPDVKSHVMRALAAISKFIGMYDSWLTLTKRYILKWSNGNGSLATLSQYLMKTVMTSNQRQTGLEKYRQFYLLDAKM
jgi:hypothetical protein